MQLNNIAQQWHLRSTQKKMKIDYTVQEQKNTVKTRLTEGIVTLTFQKSDGSNRLMKCTLQPALLPPQDPSSHPGPPNEVLQVVWDLEANGWRSFRWERLTDVQVAE
jgi:hypothetical protein